MARPVRCPRCHSSISWTVRRGETKCSICRYEWRPNHLPLRLSRSEWRRLLRWFLLGQSVDRIAEESHPERKRVLRALTLVRETIAHDIPRVFAGTIEIDETFLGGKWRNKRKNDRIVKSKQGRGTTKQPLFGILCRNGLVWAKMVSDVEAETLLPLLMQRVVSGATVCSDTFRSYTRVAARGYIHRLVRHEKKKNSDGEGNHINGLEGFWGYLKRMLDAKGGERKERLPLYLAEYVWRYNHRGLTARFQIARILSQLQTRHDISG